MNNTSHGIITRAMDFYEWTLTLSGNNNEFSKKLLIIRRNRSIIFVNIKINKRFLMIPQMAVQKACFSSTLRPQPSSLHSPICSVYGLDRKL